MARKIAGSVKHHGKSRFRQQSNPRERIFADAWEKHNSSVNASPTTLDWLLHGDGNRCFETSTQEEATNAATVIQWLGSPVGFSWLSEVIEQIKEVA